MLGTNNEGPPKLEIRLDAKNMVYIRNSVIKEASSPAELMELVSSSILMKSTYV